MRIWQLRSQVLVALSSAPAPRRRSVAQAYKSNMACLEATQQPQRLPALFLAHGGGPLPLLGDTSHDSLVAHWKSLQADFAAQLRNRVIKAILVVTAHWEESVPTITSWKDPPTLTYDYYGFPKAAYSIQYPAPGNPQLAQHVISLLERNGIKAKTNDSRGFDHGVFVPLQVIFPQADVPVLALSLINSLDPKAHIEVGRALALLRDQGVLLIGSGMSFHSMKVFMSGEGDPNWAKEFDAWLQGVATTSNPEEREQQLENWRKAPHALQCHPREEHLVPLFVVAGAAAGGRGKVIFSDQLMGAQISSFQFD